jgi:hypothetical protein
VAQVPGVLLEQVEQHALEGGRLRARPALAGLADLGQLVALDDGRAARRLFGVRRQQVVQGLGRRDVPAAVALVTPRVADGAAFEAPLQPAPLHVGQVPEQFQRRPARRHNAAAQLAGGQLTQPGGQPVAEVAEVAEEHLRPRPGWGGRLGKRDGHGGTLAGVLFRPLLRAGQGDSPATRLDDAVQALKSASTPLLANLNPEARSAVRGDEPT